MKRGWRYGQRETIGCHIVVGNPKDDRTWGSINLFFRTSKEAIKFAEGIELGSEFEGETVIKIRVTSHTTGKYFARFE